MYLFFWFNSLSLFMFLLKKSTKVHFSIILCCFFIFNFFDAIYYFKMSLSASAEKRQCIWKNVKAVAKLRQCQKQIYPFNKPLRLSLSLTASIFKHTRIPILHHNLLFRFLFGFYLPFFRNFDEFAVFRASWSKTSRISFRCRSVAAAVYNKKRF